MGEETKYISADKVLCGKNHTAKSCRACGKELCNRQCQWKDDRCHYLGSAEGIKMTNQAATSIIAETLTINKEYRIAAEILIKRHFGNALLWLTKGLWGSTHGDRIPLIW